MTLHPTVAEKWLAITGRPLVEGYGLTEASPVIACNSYLAPRLGSVGLPLPSTQISIRNGDIELPAGESGELCVRGPQVMLGYWKQAEETAKVLTADSWLHTGDIATLDAGGWLRIIDRKKDLIIVSAFKVFPNEIESVVAEHPAVLECGCIGVPDARSGQAVKIFVVLREGSSLEQDDLRHYCRERLTGYKVPTYVEFRLALPKTNVGKILRRALAEEESARAA
jgi:long-chain acyl-CoA synthetase